MLGCPQNANIDTRGTSSFLIPDIISLPILLYCGASPRCSTESNTPVGPIGARSGEKRFIVVLRGWWWHIKSDPYQE
jgi:hypothetical protein